MSKEEELVHNERVVQLQEFYSRKAPEKVAVADSLLKAHAFRNIVHTLHEKYGELPNTWAAELDSINWASSSDQGLQSAGGSSPNKEAARVAARMKSGQASIWELMGAAISIGAQESYTASTSAGSAAINVTTAGASAVAQSAFYKPPTMQRRKAQLLEFYADHDQSKSNTAHVDNLIQNFKFVDLVRALKKKFGEVPPGWEMSLPAVERMASSLFTSNKAVPDSPARCADEYHAGSGEPGELDVSFGIGNEGDEEGGEQGSEQGGEQGGEKEGDKEGGDKEGNGKAEEAAAGDESKEELGTEVEECAVTATERAASAVDDKSQVQVDTSPPQVTEAVAQAQDAITPTSQAEAELLEMLGDAPEASTESSAEQ
jgi:hypothetical protein